MLKLNESSWGIEEKQAVIECLNSDSHSMGRHVEEFETEFASWNGSKFAIMVNSGSSANLLAAATLSFVSNPKKNATVIVPALSWSTTYFPWIQTGYNIKFVDINESDFNLSIAELEKTSLENVVGICVPHILGADAGIVRIMDFAKKHNMWVVEDACESLGSQFQSDGKLKKIGTEGVFGTYSFFRSHHISTMEGGMLVTDDQDMYAVAKSLRAHGWTRNVPYSELLGNKDSSSWESRFKFYSPGYNLRPLEMSGNIGKAQLKKVDSFIEFRRKNALYFKTKLKQFPNIKLQEQSSNGSWMAFSIMTESKKTRDELVLSLEEGGIETRPIVTGDFTKQPVIEKIKDKILVTKELPNVQRVNDCGIMFANHGRDLKAEIDYLVKVFANHFQSSEGSGNYK